MIHLLYSVSMGQAIFGGFNQGRQTHLRLRMIFNVIVSDYEAWDEKAFSK